MKKEKSAVAVEAKATLASLGPGLTKLEAEADLPSPPPIKSDPDGPPSVKTNSVNGENNCDTSTPPTPTGAGGGTAEGAPATPSSLEDMKPLGGPPSQGPPSNCNNGASIKSEADSFLDTFADSKDGGGWKALLSQLMPTAADSVICLHPNSSHPPPNYPLTHTHTSSHAGLHNWWHLMETKPHTCC